MTSGLLIAFEGVDGCGKTTQIDRCRAWLAARRPERDVFVLREPGGTPLGERVREVLLDGEVVGPKAEMLLYMAARAQLYDAVVLPALEDGHAVILDRSHYSTAAYQGHGLGLDVGAIMRLATLATGGRAPDRVVLLDLDPAVARRRLTGAADRIEQRDEAYFGRVAAGYRALAEAEPRRFVVVDAAREPDAVAADIAAGLDDVG